MSESTSDLAARSDLAGNVVDNAHKKVPAKSGDAPALKIENVTKASPSGSPMAHQMEMTPDGKFLYVTDGLDGAVVKIDLSNDTIVKSIPIGGKEPHSIVFSADGKTAYIAVRHEPTENESSVFVYDVTKDQVTERIPGIAAPLVCGLVYQQ